MVSEQEYALIAARVYKAQVNQNRTILPTENPGQIEPPPVYRTLQLIDNLSEGVCDDQATTLYP